MGLVKPGSGLPLASTQGELKVESTMPRCVVLAQEGLRVVGADLDVVDALDVGEVGVDAGVGEGAVLGDGLGLQIGRPRSASGLLLG